MAGGTVAARPGQRDVSALLPLALSHPRKALAEARQVLARQPGPHEASVAHQAAGIVLRDTGDVQAGVRELRAALRLARRTGSAEREADVLATLGLALAFAGRTASGLAAFDRALELSAGALAGQVLYRRGVGLWTLGRYEEALDDLRRAVTVFQRAADPVWTSRALNLRGALYLAVGSPGRADADFVAAGRLFAQAGQVYEGIHTVLNRAAAAFAVGDLPAALSFLDEAASRYRPLNVLNPALSIDRCTVLLAAGLVGDALAEADTALRDMEQARGRSTKKAELLLTAASCALAAVQPEDALDRAQAAYRLFRSQRSAWWQAHARLVLVRAQYAAGPASGQLLRQAGQAAAALKALRSSEAAQAHLLAGRVALDLGRRGAARDHLRTAAASRRRGPALSRASGWLSDALRAEADGDTRRLLAACRRGLEVLDQHRLTLGASELRAQATGHGAELAGLALRQAARAGRPRQLLAWSERWRATALAVPAVRPPAQTELSTDLAVLRQVTSRLERARRQGVPAAGLEREQLRLEAAVRASALRVGAAADTGQGSVSVPELLDQLGTVRLVEIVDVDGLLHVLVCEPGRVRQFRAGPAQDAIRAGDFARFALRRLARGRPQDDLGSAAAILAAAGPRLQAALLGPAATELGDGPVVIVPPGRLHAIPWALLPALGQRAFSVAPSAAAWLRARAAPAPDHRHVTLARGPGLGSEGAEVPLIAPLYEDVTVLAGAEATAGRVLGALDGAWLGHVAAHGRFRAESPLFSSLRMHDGPLTVYDFEQLRRAPYRLILSSCDSGLQAPAGADELLGLVSSLLPLGTAGIVAGVVLVNDFAVVPLMVSLHRHLRDGASLAQAMCRVRQEAAGDPLSEATAMSLVALGAA
ncbi:MAG TPA: CHAT domain-containing tetratricopeptide repeat protein [Streptosporangiaceae bacterium]|nr:CHAT domain-containing tetratricopeptide repeat protein [Streptosporangiaceae bacterium]